MGGVRGLGSAATPMRLVSPAPVLVNRAPSQPPPGPPAPPPPSLYSQPTPTSHSNATPGECLGESAATRVADPSDYSPSSINSFRYVLTHFFRNSSALTLADTFTCTMADRGRSVDNVRVPTRIHHPERTCTRLNFVKLGRLCLCVALTSPERVHLGNEIPKLMFRNL